MELRRFMQSPVYCCSPDAPLSNAAAEMETHNIGSLVVTDGDKRIVGIVTDRDLALSLAHGGNGTMTVADVMSRQVVTIGPDADMDAAAGAMDDRGIRRLPVADDGGHAIGMVSLDDLYNYLTQETITLAGAMRAQGGPQA